MKALLASLVDTMVWLVAFGAIVSFATIAWLTPDQRERGRLASCALLAAFYLCFWLFGGEIGDDEIAR